GEPAIGTDVGGLPAPPLRALARSVHGAPALRGSEGGVVPSSALRGQPRSAALLVPRPGIPGLRARDPLRGRDSAHLSAARRAAVPARSRRDPGRGSSPDQPLVRLLSAQSDRSGGAAGAPREARAAGEGARLSRGLR